MVGGPKVTPMQETEYSSLVNTESQKLGNITLPLSLKCPHVLKVAVSQAKESLVTVGR